MNHIVLILLSASVLLAHDHIEIGRDEVEPGRLAFSDLFFQLALYVPPGVPLSNDSPNFPGGYFANELTFTTETNVLQPATGANPRIEFLSLTGPVGAIFAFWEAGASAPTISIPTGWTTSAEDLRSFAVVVGGDNHLHGRVFTATQPGVYQVTFRAIDAAGLYQPTADRTLTFEVLTPPQLRISLHGADVRLTFPSRPGLSYEIQSTTNLAGETWEPATAIDPLDGTGGTLEATEPLGNRQRVFYRLVEYR